MLLSIFNLTQAELIRELIGISASLIVFASVSFASVTPKRNILMRILNSIGSLVFVIYGFMIPSFSTILLNFVMIIINITHIIKIIKQTNAKLNDKNK